MFTAHIRLLLCLAAVGLLAACATTSETTRNAQSEQLFKDAQQALNEGQKEKALQLLDASARANPASAEPWVKSAQIHFEASNYPMAIKSADEAMKRDPARRETKAIAVVASLRVAMSALAEMREDASLRGNTRQEAEQLARTLRETLSVEVLVPAPAGSNGQNQNAPLAKPAIAAPAPAPATAAQPATTQPASAPAKPAARPAARRTTEPAARPEPAATGGNPFNVLK